MIYLKVFLGAASLAGDGAIDLTAFNKGLIGPKDGRSLDGVICDFAITGLDGTLLLALQCGCGLVT